MANMKRLVGINVCVCFCVRACVRPDVCGYVYLFDNIRQVHTLAHSVSPPDVVISFLLTHTRICNKHIHVYMVKLMLFVFVCVRACVRACVCVCVCVSAHIVCHPPGLCDISYFCTCTHVTTSNVIVDQ